MHWRVERTGRVARHADRSQQRAIGEKTLTRRAPCRLQILRPALRSTSSRWAAPARRRRTTLAGHRRSTERSTAEFGIGNNELAIGQFGNSDRRYKIDTCLRLAPDLESTGGLVKHENRGTPCVRYQNAPLRIDHTALRSHQLRRPACRDCRAQPASAGNSASTLAVVFEARSSVRPATARRIQDVVPPAAPASSECRLRTALRVVLHYAWCSGTGA